MRKLELLVDGINFPVHVVCFHEHGIRSLCTDKDILDYETWRDSVFDPLYDQGYDNLLLEIRWVEDSYFSYSPCFGLPCDCYRAAVWGEKKENKEE